MSAVTRRALVTGAAGFVGQWLCRELLAEGWDVTGTALALAAPEELRTLSADERRAVHWRVADVRDSRTLGAALDASRADAVFHLAGVAFLPSVAADPAGALDVNVLGLVRLLAELRPRRAAGSLDPVVVVVGSAQQYGAHPVSAQPLPETAEQRPIDPYGASKLAQEVIALQAARGDGARVLCTRSFNHSGAGQEPPFLLPRLVRDAHRLRAAGGGEMPLGNATPVRDFLHVADVARAYRLLAERGEPGEAYNVCGGTGVSVGAAAERVLALAGLDARLRSDPALQRPVDVPHLVGDPSKLRARTGWAPNYSLDSIIDELLRATAL